MANINNWAELRHQFGRISEKVNGKPKSVDSFRVWRGLKERVVGSLDLSRVLVLYDYAGDASLKRFEVYMPDRVARVEEDKFSYETNHISQDRGDLVIKRRWVKGEGGLFELEYVSVFNSLGLVDYSREQGLEGLFRNKTSEVLSARFPEYIEPGETIGGLQIGWWMDYEDALSGYAESAKTKELADVLNAPKLVIVNPLQSKKK